MTQKVNGAAYPGFWVEKNVNFIKLTFNVDLAALPAASLTLLGTSTAVTGAAVADTTFGVVDSAIVQALKAVTTKATLLGLSKYDAATKSVDVMVGVSEGWFSDNTGLIASALPVLNAVAKVTTAGTNVAIGDMVSIGAAAVTFNMNFSTFKTLPMATVAANELETGPGATSGATPANSPTGTAGFYPVHTMAG